MTDRHAGYIVRLAEDLRDDDSAYVIAAIRMIKGVAAVEPIPGDHQLHIATERAREEIADRLYALVKELRT